MPFPAACPDGAAVRIGVPLLELRGAGFRHRDGWALRNVNLAIHAGEAWGVAGESGAGKSTLASLALGLLEPTEGSVHLQGAPWPQRDRRPLVQAVPQDATASLPPHFSGWQILEQPLAVHRRGTPASRRAAAARTAARVKFPEACLDQRPHQWSGGLAQRLCLARALMLEPILLVLDEPLSALDPTLAAHLVELLLELKAGGTALLLVSHDLRAVERLCDRLLVLFDGVPVCQGPAGALLRNPVHPYLRGLVEALPDLDLAGPPRRWGLAEERRRPAGACVLYSRCPRADDACRAASGEGCLRG